MHWRNVDISIKHARHCLLYQSSIRKVSCALYIVFIFSLTCVKLNLIPYEFKVKFLPYVGVFWLNIAKFKVNWCYRYCFKLFSNLRKEKELRQYHCRNSTKVGERKIKSRREKFLIFGNGIATIPSAHSPARVGKKNWQLWGAHIISFFSFFFF